MFKAYVALAVFAPLALAGCMAESTPPLGYGPEPTTLGYTEPAASGLQGGRPYPNPDDVCRVIGENDATRDLLDDSSLLIGCPKHETGAIDDRTSEGARVAAQAKHWTLLTVPTR